MMPGVNGAIVARIKFIDECVTNLIAEGLEQLVVIGAGYDTRSYRIQEVKENLKVFEVDHPPTQATKIEKVKEIFGALPNHVTFVPLIFGKHSLGEKLIEFGYNKKLKTLFIIEGLLMYIPSTAVEGLFAFIIQASGPGSSIVADYFDTTVVEGKSSLKEAIVLRRFVENEGSSLKFGIQAGKGEDFFKQFGFRQVCCVSATTL
jgi:methyltransferase (TIGR00027 family)